MIAFFLLEWREWRDEALARDALAWMIALYLIPSIFSFLPLLSLFAFLIASLVQGGYRGSRFHQTSEIRKRIVLPGVSAGGALLGVFLSSLCGWALCAGLALPSLIISARLWSFGAVPIAAALAISAASFTIAFGFSILASMDAERNAGAASLGAIVFFAWCVPTFPIRALRWANPLASTVAIALGEGIEPLCAPLCAALGLALLGAAILRLRAKRRSYHGE